MFLASLLRSFRLLCTSSLVWLPQINVANLSFSDTPLIVARLKANLDTVSYADLRAEFLLDEYINAKPENCLPTSWGPTLNWQRYNAKLLARFSEQPELLKVPHSIFKNGQIFTRT